MDEDLNDSHDWIIAGLSECKYQSYDVIIGETCDVRFLKMIDGKECLLFNIKVTSNEDGYYLSTHMNVNKA